MIAPWKTFQRHRDGFYDVIVVGAGAAGVGMATVFKDLKLPRFLVVDREQVGASFQRWPKEMRFITPSFNSTLFGALDLNAIALDTSPANHFQTEHPSGIQYANYLQTLAKELELPIETGVNVEGVEWLEDEKEFVVTTSGGLLRSRFVVWAAGEFQYPRLDPFPGAQHCLHNSHVKTWTELQGTERIVIGAFESGLDAAINLCAGGKLVTVLNPRAKLAVGSQDPSLSLSPYTRERAALMSKQTQRLIVEGEACVSRVTRHGDVYRVTAQNGKTWETSHPPILATGFEGSLGLVRDLFSWSEQGHVELTAQDESTKTPGFYLVGPQVRHGRHIFCYIYKFRQRLAVVAEAIASRLRIDTSALAQYERQRMYLTDLTCCKAECRC